HRRCTRRSTRPGCGTNRTTGTTRRDGGLVSDNDARRYCPACATPLVQRTIETYNRLCCPACDFVFWDNPTPVVAALVEYDGRLLVARNAAWPAGKFGLITGFLEPREDPAEGVLREVDEELSLAATISCF